MTRTGKGTEHDPITVPLYTFVQTSCRAPKANFIDELRIAVEPILKPKAPERSTWRYAVQTPEQARVIASAKRTVVRDHAKERVEIYHVVRHPGAKKCTI